MNLADITPVILAFNEAANLGRSLEALGWARDIVVVDSGSADETTVIATRLPTVRLVVRPFDSAARQWNFAVHETGVATEWVLALDADYGLSPEFVRELERLDPGPDVSAFRARFTYCVFGRPLRGSLYPPVAVLFRKALGAYVQDGHTQRLRVAGVVRDLRSPIRHDDRKPLGAWLASQARYAQLEADKLGATERAALGRPDRLRRLILVAPLATPIYCLLWKGTLLDGWAGVFYALQRSVAEAALSLELLRRRLCGTDVDAPPF
jgi:glycosyltransferase involved in cell wall biosynthesis